jgi:hypothetical protein
MQRSFAELGRRLGMGPLVFNPPEPLVLEVKGVGQVFFEKTADPLDEILVCLTRPWPVHDRVTMGQALQLCAPASLSQIQLYCGSLKEQLILMTRLPLAGLSAVLLESRLDFLLKTQKKLFG